jgi:hypothetical protein
MAWFAGKQKKAFGFSLPMFNLIIIHIVLMNLMA